MNETLQVKIIAENDEGKFENTFTVKEVHNENDYGNGNYIAIFLNEQLWKYVDVRYAQKYDFENCVKEIFEAYYGKNLKLYEIIM